MTLFWIVGALVFGGLMFFYVRRQMNKADKESQIEHKLLPCPSCQFNLANGCWQMTGIRGERFKCVQCNKISVWNISVEPPQCVFKF